MGRGEDFADDVEDGIVIQRVADLLEFIQESLKDTAFDRIRRHEVENQAVFLLAVPVDTAHALFQPIGVPGDVVIEKNMTDLEVDAFARGLRSDEDLASSVPELLFRVEPGARFIAGACPHSAVNNANFEAPGFELGDKIVQGILELREYEEPLVGIIKEALLLENRFELEQLGFDVPVFHVLGLFGQAEQFLDFIADLVGVFGQGDCLEQFLETLTFALFHLFELFRVGKIGRGNLDEFDGLLEAKFQSAGAVLEAAPDGMDA